MKNQIKNLGVLGILFMSNVVFSQGENLDRDLNSGLEDVNNSYQVHIDYQEINKTLTEKDSKIISNVNSFSTERKEIIIDRNIDEDLSPIEAEDNRK